jgi:signal transduction histidine kinase
MITTSEKEKDFFTKIAQQANVLGEMIRSILVLHAPEEFVPVNLNEVVRKAIEEIRPACEVSRIDVEVVEKSDLQVPLKVSLFRRAIHNLSRNAIQAMPNGGRLLVEVGGREGVEISISDTGGGIPEEIQPSLFMPFVHNHKGGIGLGLYMVYQTITKVHRGTIHFRTEPGRGTTFVIRIPKRQRELQSL